MRILGREISLRLPWTAKNSTLATPEQWLVEALLSGLSSSGIRVTPLTVMGVPTVLACVNAVSRTLSTMPIRMYRHRGDGSKELVTDHYLADLLSYAPVPNEITAASFVRAVQANATLRNTGHVLLVRNGLGEFSELVPIEPSDLRIIVQPTTAVVEYYLRGKQIDASSIMSIKGLTFNGVLGADPLRLARDAIGLTIALQDNAARFFANGCRPGGILSHPNSLSEEAQERLRKKLTQDSSGKNSYSLMVLEEGLTFAMQRMGNNEAQFDESRARQDKAICRVFGVQPSKVGILDDAHYSNVEQENLNYSIDTILPWTTEWEQTLAMKLLKPEERKIYFFKFDDSRLGRGDRLSRYQANAMARNWGWKNADEIREEEGLDPLPNGEGKIYLQPVNMQEAGQPLTQPTDTGKPRQNGKPAPKPAPTPTT